MFKNARRLNGRQKRNITLLFVIPAILFFMWGGISEKAVRAANGQQACLAAERAAERVNTNRELYDMLKNSAPQYTPKNITEGINAENFRGYFGPRPTLK